MSLNPNAPAFQPILTQAMPAPRPRMRRRRRRRVNNRNNNNNGAASNAVNQVRQQVSQLTTLVKTVAKNAQQQAPVPQLGTATSQTAAPLLVTPLERDDVRLNSTQDALNYCYRHLRRVLQTGAGSIRGYNGHLFVQLSFPSNQTHNYQNITYDQLQQNGHPETD